MKKTVTKEEYICDFCGVKCTDKHYDFALPEKQPRECLEGKRVDEIIITQKNLCPRCTEKISDIHGLIKEFCVRGEIIINRNTTAIVFKDK